MTWTAKYNGTTKTLEDWGVEGVSRRLSSQAVDEVTFVSNVPDALADPVFPRGSTVTIYRDGVQWFVGLVDDVRPSLSNDSESISYKLVGPWWYLEREVFQQSWKYWNTSTNAEATGTSSHLMLGQKLVYNSETLTTTAVAQNTSEQIAEIMDWAIAKGAPFQKGTGFPAISIFIDEVRDITCSEAIKKVLRFAPDTVTWFDYSTTPPTLNVKRKASLSAITISTTGFPVEDVAVNPRYDLQVPSVCLKYERTDDINGQQVRVYGSDIAPTGATGNEFGALVATVDLIGGSINTVTATIKTAAVLAMSANANDRALFWKYHCPWLNQSEVLTIESSIATCSGTLANELIDGQIADWMSLNVEDDEIKAEAIITYNNKYGAPIKKRELLSARIKRTNAPVGLKTYSSVQSFEEAETQPTGLATEIYTALGALQYSGHLTIHEHEVGDKLLALGVASSYGIGLTLNLSNGRTAWASMNAVIQGVEEDIDSGVTKFTFGPADHLGIGDMIEYLRLNRSRLIISPHQCRASSSKVSGNGSVTLGKSIPAPIGSSGASDYRLQMIAASATAFSKTDTTQVDDNSKPIIKKTVAVGTVQHETTIQESRSQEKLTGPSGESIDLNTDDIKSLGDTAKGVKLREVTLYGDVDGESKQFKMVVLSSDKYNPTSIALGGGSARWQ